MVDRVPEAERESRRERLLELVSLLRERFVDLVPASDVGARRSDYTFDIGETRKVAPEIVEAASAEARRHGAFTTTSSVHLHVSFDRADKASGSLWLLHRQTGLDPTEGRLRYAFVGDSENDAACFAAFQTTVGVANLRGRLTVRPRFVTSRERGAGFAELAETLIALRNSAPTQELRQGADAESAAYSVSHSPTQSSRWVTQVALQESLSQSATQVVRVSSQASLHSITSSSSSVFWLTSGLFTSGSSTVQPILKRSRNETEREDFLNAHDDSFGIAAGCKLSDSVRALEQPTCHRAGGRIR